MIRKMMICLQGIGAGLAISIGGTVYLSVEQPVVGSVLFAVGLYAIVLNGLYLYTGKVGYLVEQEKPAPYLMLLLATWTGNLLGTAAGAALILQTRVGSGLRPWDLRDQAGGRSFQYPDPGGLLRDPDVCGCRRV